MGAKLSLLAPLAPTVAVSSYVDILSSFKYLELINNSRFVKTIKAVDKSNGNLVVIKLFIKSSDEGYVLSLQQITEHLAKQSLLLSHLPNVLPWHKLIETDRAGYLIRQLVRTNLYDRLSLRPFLQPIEKLFILFQLLKIVQQLHDLHIYHGDLKLENLLITSSNWVFLCDFSTYLKPVFIPEDNPNQFSFFFDTSDRRVCYIAPERFYNSKTSSPPKQTINDEGVYNGKDRLTSEMDLFSLGCVIAELYSDGVPAFTLSQLFKFMKGEYSLDLSPVPNENIKHLILQLVQLQPAKRVCANTLLEQSRDTIFPSFFYDFLYDFMRVMNDNDSFTVEDDDNITINDLKIDKIYSEFDKIAKAFKFQYDVNDAKAEHPDSFVPYKLNLPGIPCNYRIKSTMVSDDDRDHPALIILSLVFSMVRTVRQVNSKIKACELILALSEKVSDEAKLDRSLPYLCSILDEFIEAAASGSRESNCSTKAVCTAISCITTLLMSCSYIKPTNVLMFPEYLLPKLSYLMVSNIPTMEAISIKITLASCLPYLASVSKRFWVMSKTFKHDTLKAYESRILGFSVASGTNDGSTFNVPKDQLDAEFETLTNSLLTDPTASVKICLVNNILPLCQFFGVDKTNDIILPHLITYLNGTNIELKLVFLNSIIKLTPFIGILTFEQYFLPLLIQTLRDPEPFVILKVLQIFNEIVKKKLINPRLEFNALEIYKELLDNSVSYLLHPVEWIRQSVLVLIISISDSLTDADKYCFLYPLIRKFLTHDVSIISWNTIHPYLVKPISWLIFEKSIEWATNSSGKSLFWSQVQSSSHSSRSTTNNVLPLASMGKSVYLPKNGHEIKNLIVSEKKSNIPLAPEDRHWIFKLRSYGFDESDLWKLGVLRDYIYHVSRTRTNSDSVVEYKFNNISSEINLTPRNIFFDINYKSEPLNTSRTTQSSVDATVNNDAVSFQDYDAKTFLLPNFSRVKASLQTVEANVFGEMELSHESSGSHHSKRLADNTNDHKFTQVLYSVNNSKIITSNSSNSYNGHNPFIINYLNSLEFEPDISNFPEFGTYIKPPTTTDSQQLDPKKVHVASINTNGNSGTVDGISKVILSPSMEFFITASESGVIKVWDISKIDKIVSARNASLSIDLKSGITCIKFIPNRFVFAVSTTDGQIRLFKIDIFRGKNRRIIKYSKLRVTRKFQIQNADDFPNYVLDFDFMMSDKQSLLLGITSGSKIFAIDIVKMQYILEIENPMLFGIPLSFIFGENSWVLLGTDQGYLCLWDIRFERLIKAWKVQDQNREDSLRISKLVLLPDRNAESDKLSFLMLCGSDLTIWELPSFDCKQLLTAKTDQVSDKRYNLTEFSINMESANIEELLENLEMKSEVRERETVGSTITSLNLINHGNELLLCSASVDKTINLWNLTKYDKSTSVNLSNSQFFQTVFGSMVIKEYKNTNAPQSHCHLDVITDIAVVTQPYQMFIFVDRSGFIEIYR